MPLNSQTSCNNIAYRIGNTDPLRSEALSIWQIELQSVSASNCSLNSFDSPTSVFGGSLIGAHHAGKTSKVKTIWRLVMNLFKFVSDFDALSSGLPNVVLPMVLPMGMAYGVLAILNSMRRPFLFCF